VIGDASDSLPRQRNLILGLLIVLAAAAWAVLVWQAISTDMRMAGATMGLAAPLFLAVWVIMMVAMMFPTAAPMILTFHQVQAGKQRQGASFVATWIFVGGYMVVWTIGGIVAYGAAVASEAYAEKVGLSAVTAARIGGAILILAGLYQLSPLKNVCLAKCRTPLTFIMTSWREGVAGAIRMGVEHGLYCLGCCWLLFVILFPLGIMNVAAMAAVTLLIFAEKTLPWGRRAASVAAAILVVYGGVVIARPEALPTFMIGSEIPSPSPSTPTVIPTPGAADNDKMPGM
jgi:predicted metal-binding membrane protein